MARYRARFTRIVAAILTFAFSAQVAQAHAVNCAASAGRDTNQSAVSHESHRSNHDGSMDHNRRSHHGNTGSTGCAQTSICANAPAMTADAIRPVGTHVVERSIMTVTERPTVRIPAPEPPPPKI